MCVCMCETAVSLMQTNTTYLILASSSKIFAVVTTFPYKVIKSRLMQVCVFLAIYSYYCILSIIHPIQENAVKYNGIHDLMMKTYRYATCVCHMCVMCMSCVSNVQI